MKNARRASRLLPIVLLSYATSLSIAQTGTFIDRWDDDDIRVVTYNVYFSSIFSDSGFSPEIAERFARVINALQPDVLALQEARRSASETAQQLNALAPPSEGEEWYARSQSSGEITLSRYPYSDQHTTPRRLRGEFIDLPDHVYSENLFVENRHFLCCDNEPFRQQEADNLIRGLRDAKEPDAESALPADIPFLILGDLNIVGSGRPLETLLTGDILDNARYGPDSPPDWDGTPITDAHPLHNGVGPNDYTWRDDSQEFDPGILDFVLFSDSVLETANRFVLNPAIMTPEELAATGLQANDVIIDETIGNWDHLPVVVDFRLRPQTDPGDYNRDGAIDADDLMVWSDQYGQDAAPPADGSGDGHVNAADYTVWRDALSAADPPVVPEPTAAWLAGLPVLAGCSRRSSR